MIEIFHLVRYYDVAIIFAGMVQHVVENTHRSPRVFGPNIHLAYYTLMNGVRAQFRRFADPFVSNPEAKSGSCQPGSFCSNCSEKKTSYRSTTVSSQHNISAGSRMGTKVTGVYEGRKLMIQPVTAQSVNGPCAGFETEAQPIDDFT